MRPIFLATALQFFLQVCGVVPIVCYAVDVFKAAGTEGVHENDSTMIFGLVNLVQYTFNHLKKLYTTKKNGA
jgi:hypothetical protein